MRGSWIAERLCRPEGRCDRGNLRAGRGFRAGTARLRADDRGEDASARPSRRRSTSTAQYLYGATAPGLSIDGDIDLKPVTASRRLSRASASASTRRASSRSVSRSTSTRRPTKTARRPFRCRAAAIAGLDAALRGADHRPPRRHQRPLGRAEADAAGRAERGDHRRQAALRTTRSRKIRPARFDVIAVAPDGTRAAASRTDLAARPASSPTTSGTARTATGTTN